MFTGLVETTGQLRRITPRGPGCELTIGAPRALVAELALGESVACDGACLTVTATTADSFTVDASRETLSRTTLGERRIGDRLHLERALRVGDRFGGHIVSGHIDATGTIRSKVPVGEALNVHIDVPQSLQKYLVEKGSVAIDGVSLTVNTLDQTGFSVVLIPHTQGVVCLHTKAPGARVNLETDILGKYVERLLFARETEADAPSRASVDLDLLARSGFLR